MAENSGKVVYGLSVAVIALLVCYGILYPSSFDSVTQVLFAFIGAKFGWWYMLAMNVFVVVPIILAFSRFGGLTMGEPGEKPEFSDLSWFGMLFGAGMGVGLVFYGVGEPLYHFDSRPFGAGAMSALAAKDAIRATFFHWGLHPWASYSVIAICLAYFQFRKKGPGLISSLFLPYLGPKGQDGLLARVIDILTIFATVAGIATSLGLAVLQLNSGLNYLFGFSHDALTRFFVLLVLTGAFTFSAFSGLNKGIRYLGNFNLALFIVLGLSMFLVGPSIKLLETFMTGLGSYFSNIVGQSFDLDPYGQGHKSWLNDWTLYYWAWWVAWAPFVGSFVARISKGRTVRQFVLGVLLAPSLGCFSWFATFGGTALSIQMSG
ncbi:MAG: BCCT family transporter, partial [Deltaproteobacteria bacterium]|nr:BCCT family transporter [Deltaproteobacteria bacterium]